MSNIKNQIDSIVKYRKLSIIKRFW